MPQKSRWTVPVPEVSLSTFIFGPPGAALPDTLAYADAESPETLSLTWATYRLWSQRFAAGLAAAGLRAGDRVLVFVGNDVCFPVLQSGTLMAGGIFSTANSHFIAREVVHQLVLTEPRFLIAGREQLPVALEAAKMAGMERERVFVFDNEPLQREDGGEDAPQADGGVVRHWKALLASEAVGRRFVWDELSPEEAKTRTAILVFSSGTTGLPKGIEITHYAMVANTVQASFTMSLDPELRTVEQSSRRSRWLCCLPLYHGLGLIYYCHMSAARRVPTYVMKQFEVEKLLTHVRQFQITELQGVPPIIVAITKNPGVRDGRCDLSSLTKAFSCAAPLGAEVSVLFEKLWPDGVMKVQQALAQTETGGATIGWDARLRPVPGSVGEPFPNCEIMLADDAGDEVAKGERGEIWVRSPSLMKRYWNNPKATAETFSDDGWLKTGDIGCQDENGWYYVVDRKKELIKVKGVQVAPAELEAILLDHPEIMDAAVIGVSPKWGEEEAPRAFVVPAAGATATKQDIFDFVAQRVSTIKRLTGGVAFVDSIPKAPSGKILRRLLREQVAREAKPSRL